MLRLNNRYCCIIDWEIAFINSVNLIKNLFQLCVKKKLSSFQLIRIFFQNGGVILLPRDAVAHWVTAILKKKLIVYWIEWDCGCSLVGDATRTVR